MSRKIDINSASVEDLSKLFGVGRMRAEAIVAYRQTHQGFSSLTDLAFIPGLSQSTLDQNRNRIVCRTYFAQGTHNLRNSPCNSSYSNDGICFRTRQSRNSLNSSQSPPVVSNQRKKERKPVSERNEETGPSTSGILDDNSETKRTKRKSECDPDKRPSPSKRTCRALSEKAPSPPSSPKKLSDSLLKRRQSMRFLPPPNLSQWLNTFQQWEPTEQLHALDELIAHCDPSQVRHMMSVIEPQFQRDFISLLPKELALHVLSFLEPRDLLRAAQTCQYWRILTEDNILWKEKCKEAGIEELSARDMRRRTLNGGIAKSPWKSMFLRTHQIEFNWRHGPFKPHKVLKGHDDHVITCLQFNGHRIVSGSDDNTLKVWSAVTGKCLRTLVGHTGGVWSSQMTRNIIVSGSTDRTLKVWNADTGHCIYTLFGHTSTVRCMHLHDSRVVSGSRDASLRVWDINTGQCLHVLMGHQAAVRCVQYDGNRVVSGAYDYMVKIWNPDTEECLHTLSAHTNRVYSLQFPNSRRRFNASSHFRDCIRHNSAISSLPLYPKTVVLGSSAYSTRNLSTFDGTHIVSGSLDTSIRVWDAETGECRHTLTGHQSLTSGMELKENILVSGNADSTVKIWDIITGQCLQTLQGANKHQSAVTSLQFDKKFVITSSDDGTVKLWDLKTGEFIRNLVSLDSGGNGGVVWRVQANQTKLVCAVGSRNGTEETKLLVLDFDAEVAKDHLRKKLTPCTS